jgi:hypothetical protein
VRCPVGVSASGIVIEARVCGNDSVGIGKAMSWRVRCNMSRSRSNSKDIMIVRCPVRCLGIERHDRSCMLEQWATIQRDKILRSWLDSKYRAEEELLIVQLRSVKLEGEMGGGVFLFFSNAMMGKFILLKAKKIFLSIANPLSCSVLLTPLHFHPDIQFELCSLTLWKV